MKKVTPVIKKTRTKTEEYEVCPHCNQEIREKEHFIDPENYIYHSPCYEQGPIDKIKPMSPKELADAFGWGKPVSEEKDEEVEKSLRHERSRSPVAEEIRNRL